MITLTPQELFDKLVARYGDRYEVTVASYWWNSKPTSMLPAQYSVVTIRLWGTTQGPYLYLHLYDSYEELILNLDRELKWWHDRLELESYSPRQAKMIEVFRSKGLPKDSALAFAARVQGKDDTVLVMALTALGVSAKELSEILNTSA